MSDTNKNLPFTRAAAEEELRRIRALLLECRFGTRKTDMDDDEINYVRLSLDVALKELGEEHK